MRNSFWRLMLVVAALPLAACETTNRSTSLSLEGRLRLADAMGNGNPVQRLTLLREAAQQGSNRVVLEQLSAAAEAVSAFDEAAEAQRRLLALEGRTEPRLVAIGRLAMRAGDAAGAAQAYEQALAINPRSADALGGIGLAHDLAGNRDAAQDAYRRGIALAPSNWVLRSNLGVSLVSSGAPRDAIVVLSDAEIVATAPVHARHNLALAFAADGQPERAARVLRTNMGNAEALSMVRDLSAFAQWLQPSTPAAFAEPARLADPGAIASTATASRAMASSAPPPSAPSPSAPSPSAPSPSAMASAVTAFDGGGRAASRAAAAPSRAGESLASHGGGPVDGPTGAPLGGQLNFAMGGAMDSPRAAPAASPTPPREDIRIVEAPPAAPEALPLVTQLSPVDPAPAPVMTATLLPPGQALPEEIVVTAPPPFATWSSDERAPARARTRGQPAPASEWAASTTVAAFAELRDMPVRGVSNPAMSGTNAASAEAAAPSGASTEGGQRRSEGAAQVQFLAAGSEAGAQAEWARLQSRVPELANRSPVITRFEREGFPTFWRVRADGFTDAADARAFCAQLRSRAVNCMPVGG